MKYGQNEIQLENLTVKELDKRAKQIVKKLKDKKEQLKKLIDPFLNTEDIHLLAAIHRLILRRHAYYKTFNLIYRVLDLAKKQGISEKEADAILDMPLDEVPSHLPNDLNAKKVNKICDTILSLTIQKIQTEAAVWFHHLKKPTESKTSEEINLIMKDFSSENMYTLKNKMYEIADAICEDDGELYEDCLRFLNGFYGRYTEKVTRKTED